MSKFDESAARWRTSALGATFYGRKVAEMDRNELLSVIGHLTETVARGHEEWSRQLEFGRQVRGGRHHPDL